MNPKEDIGNEIQSDSALDTVPGDKYNGKIAKDRNGNEIYELQHVLKAFELGPLCVVEIIYDDK